MVGFVDQPAAADEGQRNREADLEPGQAAAGLEVSFAGEDLESPLPHAHLAERGIGFGAGARGGRLSGALVFGCFVWPLAFLMNTDLIVFKRVYPGKLCIFIQTHRMKMLPGLVAVIWSLFSSVSVCQAQPPGSSTDSTPDLYSNAQRLDDSAGTLFQKQYIHMGHILNCSLDLIHFTDLISGTRFSALKFSGTDGRVAVLDSDEVVGLTVAMHLINEKVLATHPANYTETRYRSRCGLEAGCFTEKGGWTTYLWLRQHDAAAFVRMKKSDFDVFLEILDKVKAKL